MGNRYGKKRVPDCKCTDDFTCGPCLQNAPLIAPAVHEQGNTSMKDHDAIYEDCEDVADGDIPAAPIVEPAPVQAAEMAHLLNFVQNYCPVNVQNEIRALLRRYNATSAPIPAHTAVLGEIGARIHPEALATVKVNKVRLDELCAKMAEMDAAERTVYDVDDTDGRTYAETILECAASVAGSAH